ncbi:MULTISPECIES: tetratricopeptide repeat protein [Streptomyces]|uniref:ATP-binding protein n=1 Tax=Streptomyces TaxID=1883 RepID=UPI0009A1C4DD|nr:MULTISPECIES: tetratricopeptide repeat protein [unclassified Streptomyces]QNQ34956.1 tetratricopeptide repeat protein [Streptomyces sp. CB00271]
MTRKSEVTASGQGSVAIGQDNIGSIFTGPVTIGTEVKGSDTRKPSRSLPPEVPDFTGRQLEVEKVIESAIDPTGSLATVITGKPGVGKTSLALHVAHRCNGIYSDGSFYADLRGVEKHPTPPHEVLGRLLSGAGIAEKNIPADSDARLDLFRTEFTNRRSIIVLDNAGAENQVRPLIPPGNESLVLITSRFQLNGLEAVRQISLDVFDEESSLCFLRKVVGDKAVDGSISSASQVASLCGHLPLALRIAGNRLRTIRMEELEEELRDQHNRLEALEAGDLAIRAAFNLSFRQLGKNGRNSLKRLSCVPGIDFGAGICSALNDSDERVALRTLRKLHETNLIEPSATPGRYRFHDLIRVYAREQFNEDPPKKADAAVNRMLDWISYSSLKANMTLNGQIRRIQLPSVCMAKIDSIDEATDWLSSEIPNAVSAIHALSQCGKPNTAKSLAIQLCGACELTGNWQGWEDAINQGESLSKQFPDPLFEVSILSTKADLYRYRREFELALPLADKVYRAAQSAENKLIMANSAKLLGCLRMDIGDSSGALPLLEECLSLSTELGLKHEIGAALYNIGTVHRASGRTREAIHHFQQDLEICFESNDLSGAAETMNTLALTYMEMGNFSEAEKYQNEALRIFQTFNNPHKVSMVCNDLAINLRQQGRTEEALALHLEDIENSRACGNTSGEALAKSNAAVILTQLDRSKEAELLSSEALATFTSLGDHVRLARAHIGRIPLLFEVGQVDLALQEATTAIDVLLRQGELTDAVNAHESLALEFNKKDENSRALFHIDEALRITADLASPVLRATTCLIGIDIYHALEMKDSAIQCVRDLTAITDEYPEIASHLVGEFPTLVRKGYPDLVTRQSGSDPSGSPSE